MKNKPAGTGMKRMYFILLFLLVFSGFGQMPIFKRYYVADIPGLGWTADFFITHMIHYISATLLFIFLGYIITGYLISGRKRLILTGAAYIRIVLIGGLIVTGIFRVLKNMHTITFSPEFTQWIDIGHLFLTMLFLITALVLSILQRGWVATRLERNK